MKAESGFKNWRFQYYSIKYKLSFFEEMIIIFHGPMIILMIWEKMFRLIFSGTERFLHFSIFAFVLGQITDFRVPQTQLHSFELKRLVCRMAYYAFFGNFGIRERGGGGREGRKMSKITNNLQRIFQYFVVFVWNGHLFVVIGIVLIVSLSRF